MAKTKKPTERAQVEQKVSSLAGLLQICALFVGFAILVLPAFLPTLSVPVWAAPMTFGIAAGLSPEQMFNLLTKAIQVVRTEKRK
jgi:uncharacterized membrane protein (DUF485 family)